ncbi:hypothetical protein [Bradyrhizobium sp. SHOUNA76]|uniref:hypothetical protein n=1 Tax=Bradyrhizobium sp. SHOUNA76 TaxID=2908927 RepID=UPI001FF13DB8|nr:hypothetical protein [Bradyrhizobium sp. SHOUNA76]MCJ9701730.1 hypothetical protein [Bradyrhizobium sp. SHOUNA76]
MAALNERQRKFVHALFQAPRSLGAGLFAARAAGYGTPTSSNNSLSAIAYQVQQEPKIQAAIAEVSKQYLTMLGPVAVRAMKRVLGNDKHREFGRVLGILMDRVAPAQSTHTVKVEHDASPQLVATAAVMRRITELATQAGLDVERMPQLLDAKPIAKSERAA